LAHWDLTVQTTMFNPEIYINMDQFPIIPKSDIPPPRGRGGAKEYPYAKLAIAESFIAGPYSEVLKIRIGVSNGYYGDKLNRKFSYRKVDGQLQVWRIA
jgi:hypothetical protein